MRPEQQTAVTPKPEAALAVGKLLRKVVFGDWAIGTIRGADGDLRIVGESVARLSEGEVYEFEGIHGEHPKYGKQFQVRAARVSIEGDRLALEKHLVDHFDGVGPKRAEDIVGWFESNATLEDLRTLLVREPWKLESHPSTAGMQKLIRRKPGFDHTDQTHIFNQLSTRYSDLGLGSALLRRIASWLFKQYCGENPDQGSLEGDPVQQAIDGFMGDPFAPIQEVPGYGFTLADKIAGREKIPRDADCRLAAAVHHVLAQAVQSEGHVYLHIGVLAERVNALAPRVPLAKAITCADQRGYQIVVDGPRVYPAANLEVEQRTAAMVAAMLKDAPPIVPPAFQGALRDKVTFAAKQNEPPLDENQIEVVYRMLTESCRLHTLTAGPGCGKTALMQVMSRLVPGVVKFCAPTGKAAKVLTHRVRPNGLRATTVHSLLEPDLEGFTRNEQNPLNADLVGLDEAGMFDALIFYALLKALPERAHLVMLGDTDQLPSVGYGNVLADVLALPAGHHRLSLTYRNQGDILRLVNNTRLGQFDLPEHPDGTVRLMPLRASLPDAIEEVLGEHLRSVEEVGIENAILAIPRRTGSTREPNWSTAYLNLRLQAALNPDGDQMPGQGLRDGDRVIIRKNMVADPKGDNPESVVNGDTGRIVGFEVGDRTVKACSIVLDDGRKVRLVDEQVGVIDLAYALTVHAVQGSEYLRVIVIVTDGGSSFIHRRMALTAFSRAREQLVIHADPGVLTRVVARPGPRRNSHLVQRTAQLLETTCSSPSH